MSNANDHTDQKPLQTSDVAKLLGVSVRTVQDWRRSNRGPIYHRLSPQLIRYYQSDLDTWIEASRVTPTSPAP
jgi:predicted DNA-binding transcriptional regulator AlpA